MNLGDNVNRTKYLIFAIIIISYMIFAQYLLNVLQRNAAATFEPLWYILISYVVYLILGVILGIEHMVNNWEKKSPWRLNSGKLLFVGVPLVVLILYIPLYHWCYQWFCLPIPGVLSLNKFDNIVIVILGYIISTCFYKENGSI
jgi:hypothetical protein